jgi:signal transduction histidine kinase
MTQANSTAHLPVWRRLRWNLVFYFVILAVAPLVVVQTVTIIQTARQSQQQVFNQLESVAELKEAQITNWLEAGRVALDSISANAETYSRILDLMASESDRDVIVNQRLREVTIAYPLLEEVFLYTLDGRVVSASSETQIGKVVNRQPYYEGSLSKNLYIQPPFYSVGNGELVVIITRAVTNRRGQPVGILAGRLDISTLGKIMTERTGLGETGETYLVSRENNYMLTRSRFPGYALNRAYHSEGIDSALNGENGSGVYVNYRTPPTRVLGVYRWIPTLEVAMLAEVDEAEALAASIQQINVSIILTITAALIAVGLGLFTAIRIANPIAALTRIATRIAQGDLSQRMTRYPQNEIGIMATAFNQMTEQLVENIAKLDEQVKIIEKSNKELRIANNKAKEAARLKSEFMATMSHELRTPLNAILGFTGIMLEGMGGEIDEEAQHMLERVDSNSKRLLGLINDILDIAKIEAGRMNIVSEPMRPAELVDRWQAQMSVLAEQKALDFEIYLDPALPDVIYGDAERITQVVVNLLSNAFKFTEKGKVTLALERNEQNWLISVTDTGVGIPPHAINYIFDEFRQVDGTSTRMYGGSGLGLSIVRNLCRMMDGSIKVASTLGMGSTFTVTLPLKVDESQYELQAV